MVNSLCHMWPFCVEINYYSVMYFNCFTAFKVYLINSDKGGTQNACNASSCIDPNTTVKIVASFTQCV